MKLTSALAISLATLALSLPGGNDPAHAAAPEDAITKSPATLDPEKVESEIQAHYSNAHPEVQEYVRMTARTFGRSGLWLNEGALATLSPEDREKKIKYLADLLKDGEYGRHLCRGLAEAGSLKDERLLPGLLKVAGYHLDDRDYDCRPKWMAVAALARQNSDEAVPLLISLVDHGNQNTRLWAEAALVRKTGQEFRKDKQAWAKWWEREGHQPIEQKYLEPWRPPAPIKAQ